MLFAVLVDEVGPAIEDGVRGVVAEVKEEWFVLVALHELDCFQIEAIGEVLLVAESVLLEVEPANRLGAENVGPEIRPVAYALDLAPGVPVEAVIGWTNLELGPLVFIAGEVPFARHSRGIAVAFKNLRQGDVADGEGIGGVRSEIIQYAHPGGVLAGQEGRPIGRAYGCGGVGIGEAHTLLGQLVEMGRFMEGIAIAGELRPAEVVGQHEYNVRLLLLGKNV